MGHFHNRRISLLTGRLRLRDHRIGDLRIRFDPASCSIALGPRSPPVTTQRRTERHSKLHQPDRSNLRNASCLPSSLPCLLLYNTLHLLVEPEIQYNPIRQRFIRNFPREFGRWRTRKGSSEFSLQPARPSPVHSIGPLQVRVARLVLIHIESSSRSISLSAVRSSITILHRWRSNSSIALGATCVWWLTHQ